MSTKTILRIIPAEKINMGGIILDQPLPAKDLDYFDPFLLIHHGKNTASGGKHVSETGIGPHPHRGFSPVTFIFEGDVHHKDSEGNSAVVKAGGTQWMFAGKGIIHAERSSKAFAESGGDFELIQFWVNAPAKHKMDNPYYKPIQKEDTPTIENEGVTIQIVAGEYESKKGAITYMIPLLLLRFHMIEASKHTLVVEKDHNTIIYLLDGELTINDEKVVMKDMVCFNQDGKEIHITAKEDTRFIVLSGEPINEPVAAYGPFVMNLQTEIWRAMQDYESGAMGKLIENF